MIAIVGLLALTVRLGAMLATPDLPLTADPSNYALHARAIAATGQYPASTVAPAGGPTAIRPPGFPYFLAAVYTITGDGVTAGRIAQAALGALIAVLVALIGREVFGLRAGVIAGLLTAFFPPLVVNGLTLLSEPLFVVLELCAVLAVLRWRRTQRLTWVALAGVATGCAFLTRANALLVALVLALAVLPSGRLKEPRAWLALALLVVSALMVVAPWTIRNAREFEEFVPVSTQDGYTLIGTYNDTSRTWNAVWIPGNIDPPTRALIRRHSLDDEAELNRELRAAARRFALEHPAYIAEVGARNLLRLFNLGGAAHQRLVASADYGLGVGWAKLLTWSMVPVLVLAAAGLSTRSARSAPRWFWVMPILLLSTVFVLATNRHRAAIDPFLLIAAALGIGAALRAPRHVAGAGMSRRW